MIRIDYDSVLKVSPTARYTQKEALVILGVSRATFQRLLAKKAIDYVIYGKRKRFTGAALSRFVESLPINPIAIAVSKQSTNE